MNATTDNPNAGTAPGDETAASPPVVINAQYIKDLSFEAPNTPAIFATMRNQAPDISINVDVQAKPVEANTFEVVLHFKTECKAGGGVAFILELAYGGLFTLNVPQEHLHPMLLIECPRLLFPFARNIINDATRDGGFPPLMLGPIDFVAMYQSQLAQLQEQAAQAKASGNGGTASA